MQNNTGNILWLTLCNFDFLIMQGGVTAMIILTVQVVYCAVQMQTSSNRARVQESGALTPVKQTGLCLVWVLLLVIIST